jgi:BirA family biotin operon repressor/biotin-[acetyl-CoA-carboxylase] ligase
MNQNHLEQLADKILATIRTRPKQIFKIIALGKKLKADGSEIHAAAKILKSWGYGVKLSKSEIVFVSAADSLSATEINHYLKTKIIGKKILSFHSVKSTNDIAAQMAAKGAAEGTVITAEKQTLGRGRLGRSWHSPEKVGAYISIILRPKITPDKAPGLSIMTALAAADTFEKQCPGKIKIKWPNDVLINKRKISGVLTELYTDKNKTDYIIVGIGININQKPNDFPKSVKKTATSLRQATGRKMNRAELTAEFLKCFEREYKSYQKNQLAGSIKRIRSYSSLLGQTLTLRTGANRITGQAVDIDKTGALIIERDGEQITLSGGEVTIVKKP